MDRREKREIARKIAKAEMNKDYKYLEETIPALNLSLEDLFWIDEEVQRILSNNSFNYE